MAEITYRRPEVSDAKNIVDFYNYVGGETSYLSFEKDEYPLDVAAQEAAIRELEGNDKTGKRLQGLRPSALHIRSKQDTMASWVSL